MVWQCPRFGGLVCTLVTSRGWESKLSPSLLQTSAKCATWRQDRTLPATQHFKTRYSLFRNVSLMHDKLIIDFCGDFLLKEHLRTLGCYSTVLKWWCS
jgi:hypothetical protein